MFSQEKNRTWPELESWNAACAALGLPPLLHAANLKPQKMWLNLMRHIHLKAHALTERCNQGALGITERRLCIGESVYIPLIKQAQEQDSEAIPPFFPGDRSFMTPIIAAFRQDETLRPEDEDAERRGVQLRCPIPATLTK